MGVIELIGFSAALLTSLCNLPQLLRVLRKRKTAGISIRTYLLLCSGLCLWVIYGVASRDIPIMAANSVSLLLTLPILFIVIKKRYRKNMNS